MLNILIVEDEQAIANLIYVNLSDEGYRCVCAFDSKQGADLIEKETFDLILLDIMLPEIDGYELLEYIKPLGTPVIFITAKGAADDRIRGLKLGADDYIVKPFQIGELSARVEAVLRRYGKSEKQLAVHNVFINKESRQALKGASSDNGSVYDKKYFEEYAARALVTAGLITSSFCSDWVGKNIECPDIQIQDLSIGIEVTRAVGPQDAKNVNFINQLLNRGLSSAKMNDEICEWDRRCQSGLVAKDVDDGVVMVGRNCLGDTTEYIKQIVEAVKDKTKKLKCYKKFDNNWLFIFASFGCLGKDDFDTALNESIVSQFADRYDKYLILSGDTLFVYSKKLEFLCSVELPSDELAGIKRQMTACPRMRI